MYEGVVRAALHERATVKMPCMFSTISDLLENGEPVSVQSGMDFLADGFLPPELSGKFLETPVQFAGYIDETLTSEERIAYCSHVVVDPSFFPDSSRLFFQISRNASLTHPVFRSRYPEDFHISLDISEKKRMCAPISREYPERARYARPRSNDIVLRLHAAGDIADHFSGMDDHRKRAHLRQGGWLALSDRISILADMGDHLELYMEETEVGELLDNTLAYVQYLEFWFDAVQAAFPRGLFHDASMTPKADHSWPDRPRLALDSYERSLLAFHAARGELFDPLVLFDEDLDNMPDGSVVGYAGKEPKS